MPYFFKPLGARAWGFIAASVGGTFAIGIFREIALLRQREIPLFNEADVVHSEEHARYPCKTFLGYDVVVTNHYVREKGRGEQSLLPRGSDAENGNCGRSDRGGVMKKLFACFSNETYTTAGYSDSVSEVNELYLVREVVGDAHAPRGDVSTRSVKGFNGDDDDAVEDTVGNRVGSSMFIASSSWPPGTVKYTSMTIETSHNEVRNDSDALLRRWSNRVTQQSLVRCDPLAPASMNCLADASYLGAPYLRIMLSALLLLPSPLPRLRVAVLGVGGGSLPSFLQQHFSHDIMRLDLVDAEQQCFRAAVEDMGMRKKMQGGSVTCHVQDGAAFLQDVVGSSTGTGESNSTFDELVSSRTHSGTSVSFKGGDYPTNGNQHKPLSRYQVQPATCYDVLFVDLFVGSDPPAFMSSLIFLQLCREALSSIGVAAFNLPKSDPDFVQMCQRVFGSQNVYQVPVPASANIVVLARCAAGAGVGHTIYEERSHVAHRHFYRRAQQLQKSHGLPYDLSSHYPIWWRLW
ncbi:uncharacterized protein TEOVI_000256100 [Trypanosoma equiperdum]|uniref:Uncharacterized protein n=1 Tax=Trypanosoma equiperdum TaxID=5694 RepID=A0A1G4IFC2_TRYEQ|nr:hypothetical protein, conserved [Trypanosoma equiperdum]